MKQVLHDLYKEIMHVSAEEIGENRCVICLEPLLSGGMVEHYQDIHNGLTRKIFQVDFGDNSIINRLFSGIFNDRSYNGCRICGGSGKSDGGIVEHFSKRHPFIVRFLNKWNFKIR